MVCHKTAINLWAALKKKPDHVLSILCVVHITSQIFDSRNTTMGGFKMVKSHLGQLESFVFSISPACNWSLGSLSDLLEDLAVSHFHGVLLKFLKDNVHLCYQKIFTNGEA